MTTAETFTTKPAGSSIALIRWAKKNPPQEPQTSFAGKTVLITGANSGLGFEAATKMAALGVKSLIFAVRSPDRGKAAKLAIEHKTGIAKDAIQILKLDMSDFDSIEMFVQELSIMVPVLDAVLLNAGIAPATYKRSAHGWESSLQVNVISTAYLGILLLPKLRNTVKATGKPAVLDFVASVGHGDPKAEAVSAKSVLDKVNDPQTFNWVQAYSISKLLEVWAYKHIADRVSPSQVIVNCCCPGLCQSGLGKEFNIVLRTLDSVWKKLMARTAEQGSRTLVSAVTLGSDSHGGFWTHDRLAEFDLMVTSEEGQKLGNQFWEELMGVLKNRNSEVEGILVA